MLHCANLLVSNDERGQARCPSAQKSRRRPAANRDDDKKHDNHLKGWRPAAPAEDSDGHCRLQGNSQACLPGKDHQTKTDGGGDNKRNDGELAQHAMAHLERGGVEMGMVGMMDAFLACCSHVLRHAMRMQRRQQQHRHKHRQQHPCQPSAAASRSLHGCKGKIRYHPPVYYIFRLMDGY